MDEFLNHALSEVNRQHEALENECRLLKELLKPWPRKKRLVEEVENMETKSPPEAQAPPEILSYAEQQVDELLRKAEKARHLKSKVKPVVDGVIRLETCILKNTEDNSCTSQSSSRLVNDCLVDNKDLEINNNTCKAVPSRVPSPHTESLSKQASEIRLSQPATNLPKRNVIVKKNSASSERSKESKHENVRPHSHKPSSSRIRHIPAHMLAPFKTSNCTSLPKRKSNHLSGYSSSARVVKTPLSVSTKTYKTLPEIARDSKRVTQSSNTCDYPATKNSYRKSGCVKEASSISLCNNNTNNIELDESTHRPNSSISSEDTKLSSLAFDLKATVDRASENSSTCTQSTERGQSLQNVSEAQTSLTEKEPEQFTLQKNGSSMKLPNKLIKLVNTNRSLREKLVTAKLSKKTSTVLAAQQFVEGLYAEDDVSPELRTCVSALTCLRSHQMLMDTLQALHMDQLSESSSTEVLYRAKKTLEFTLTVFAGLQEEADYLTQVKYRHAAPVSDISRQFMDQGVTFWLDTGQKRDFQYGCWEHLQTSRRWNHLNFTEKYLQLNINLIKTALAEWWPVLLENRDLSVFQAAYGLLTSHGHFLPALVENPVTQH